MKYDDTRALIILRDKCDELYDVLREVCREFCVVGDKNDNEYGQRPLNCKDSEALKRVMKTLGRENGDPEYTVWSEEMLNLY